MRRIPDILIVIDQQRELTAIKEAMSLNIPVISMLDSDCDPDLVSMAIPGNDNSKKSVRLSLEILNPSFYNFILIVFIFINLNRKKK